VFGRMGEFTADVYHPASATGNNRMALIYIDLVWKFSLAYRSRALSSLHLLVSYSTVARLYLSPEILGAGSQTERTDAVFAYYSILLAVLGVSGGVLSSAHPDHNLHG